MDEPSGVTLLRTFIGNEYPVLSLAFDPTGETLAKGSGANWVKLWDVQSGKLLRTLEHHSGSALSVAFDPWDGMLAAGSSNGTVSLWNARTGKLLGTLEDHKGPVYSLAFDPEGTILASGSRDTTVKMWDVRSGKLLRTLQGHEDEVLGVMFDPPGSTLVSVSSDKTCFWDSRSGQLCDTLEDFTSSLTCAFAPQRPIFACAGLYYDIRLFGARGPKLLRTLEGHTDFVTNVVFSPDGQLLASKGHDGTIRLWNCDSWEMVATIDAPLHERISLQALTFHPKLPLLASNAGKSPQAIYLWHLDLNVLLRRAATMPSARRAVHHTTAKIVLVGDHSVGKSALGQRLIHGAFREQASTHGQQFWPFPALGQRRADGTECEAILWDFAGQPDYRLVHALFLDNADLALALFDASDLHDPLHGVGFWLKQLQSGQSSCPIILVAAQTDRGSCSLTSQELDAFCKKHNIKGPIATSAFTGQGFDQLVAEMKSLIPWNDKPATVTTATFKRVKDYVLGLKEAKLEREIIVSPEYLRTYLQSTDADWDFTDAEMLTAVSHLENYGYVKRLRTSKGEERVLLQPERLNNLASSFVLEARRNPKGLGALEEKRLLAGSYDFPELKSLADGDRDVLLDSAVVLFLEHNVCFREIDPLRKEPYLVFPELINLKKPAEDQAPVEDGVAYTVTGPTENVFASLVVLLGYTHTFTRTSQWHNNARYVVGDALVCGFRQEAERDGELDFVLCFGSNVGSSVRTLFQGLFESFLARRNLTVLRFEPVRCTNVKCHHPLDPSVMRQRRKEGKTFAFCNDCGERLILPAMAEPIQLSREVQAAVNSERQAAEQRTYFEEAIFRVNAYVGDQKIKSPVSFISYAWGVAEHERWVEKRLAVDLQKAGINILLDRWHNAQIGSSVPRFVDRIEKSDRILMIGTPAYRRKYENKDSATGTVVAAEVDLINVRLIGTESQKESVLPLLLDGDKETSFPPLVQSRAYADFRDEDSYFATAFDVILDLYQLRNKHLFTGLHDSLRKREIR